jgi:ABC-type cobalamin/Fe3+-siderophores transport system ATPase subunit
MGRHPFIPRFSRPASEDIDLVEAALAEMDVSALRQRSVMQLSGGEKQRVLVARALAQNTEVLLLDEPTASLDIRHTFDIMRALRQRVSTAGTTAIATIHDLDLASVFCDELLVLSQGRVYRQGPVASVMTRELIREVFSAEAEVSPDFLLGKPRVQYRYEHA